jgi:hypothetical protein
MENAPGPPEHEKKCVHISLPKCTRMHYITRRSNWMHKHKFGIKDTNAHFVNSAVVPPKYEKMCIDVSWPGRTKIHYATRISHEM